jgi:hypothetical protein
VIARVKVVPEPRSLDDLQAVREALPLVPGSIEDCCTRVRDRTFVLSRDEARAWITFLDALGLVDDTDNGFHRTREDIDRETLGERFRERVFGVEELLAILDGEGKTLDEVFEEFRDTVPQWERNRHTDWEAEWQNQVEALLEWAVTFELVTEDGGKYRR